MILRFIYLFTLFVLFSSPSFSQPQTSTPIIVQDPVPLAVVMAAGLINLHGPVEYRPRESAKAPKPLAARRNFSEREIYARKADNKDLYSGSLSLANANP